jgi:gliding motility-associated-like protein
MTASPDLRSAVAASLVLLGLASSAHDHGTGSHPSGRVQYVANKGQWPQQVAFKASFPNSAMFLQADAITWTRYQDDASALVHDYIQWPEEQQASFSLRGHAWRMHFVGASPAVAIHGEQVRSEYHNYFLGSDPAKWASNVPVYEGVHYEQLWPGIDLSWHSAEGQLKYDLLLAAGADADRIRFRYEALDGISVNGEGNLVMRTSVGELTEMRPVAWYADDHSPLPCAFAVNGDEVSFVFPQGADRSRAIVIDPTLMGATYSGQVGASNYGHCATYDEAGHMYGGAQNFGNTFPASLGAFQTSPGGGAGTDMVVNKFSPDATTLIWATYIGGTSDDKPHSMIVNSSEEICVLGSTTGTGFPTSVGAYDQTHNGASDIVIVHLNSTATALIGSTYLGGTAQDGRQIMTNNYGDTYRGEIMLDADDNIFIAASAQSSDFPTTAGVVQPALAGGQDAVVVGIVPDCSALLWSTFIGSATDDNGLGIRFDAAGDIYVCGATTATDFPVPATGWQSTYQGGTRDGYLLKLAGDGSSIIAGTFFGTASLDMAYFLDIDSEGDVYIFGQSNGTVPIEPAGIYGQVGGGIFVASFDPALTAPIFTTALGADMAPVAFLVDVCDHIYISGYNPSGAWETTPDALYAQGGSSFYLAAFDIDMAGILFGTYYGGSHVDGGTSRFDKAGVIYQGVCSGGQSMPTTSDAYAPTNNVGWDLGVFKIDFEQLLSVSIGGAPGAEICVNTPVTLTAEGGADQWTWILPDGSTTTGASIVVTFDQIGPQEITLIGIASGTCNATDTSTTVVDVVAPLEMVPLFTADPQATCTNFSVDLANTSTGSTNYFWDFGDTGTSTDAAPSHAYAGPGTYQISLSLIDLVCADTVTVVQSITLTLPEIAVELPSPLVLCDGASVTMQAPAGFETYTWSEGTLGQNVSVDEPGTYWLDVTLGLCAPSDTVDVFPQTQYPPMTDREICPDRPTALGPAFTPQQILWSTEETEASISTADPGSYSFIATDPEGCTVMDTVEVTLTSVALGDPILPNVFSPNGDHMNEEFKMMNIDPAGFHMDIYNRWGQRVYETANSNNGWNGKLENVGETVPDGTYFVIVTYNAFCKSNEATTLTGHVTLLR